MTESSDIEAPSTESEVPVGVFHQWIEHRKALAGRLHDGCQQDLSILVLELGRLRRSLHDIDGAGAAMRDLIEQTTRIQEELRAVTIDLYPPALTTQGLVAALSAESRRHDLPIEVSAPPDASVPTHLEPAIFFFSRAVFLASGTHSGRGVTLTLGEDEDAVWAKASLSISADAAEEVQTAVKPLAVASGGSCELSLSEGPPLVTASWPSIEGQMPNRFRPSQ